MRAFLIAVALTTIAVEGFTTTRTVTSLGINHGIVNNLISEPSSKALKRSGKLHMTATTASGSFAEEPDATKGGDASMSNLIFNLVKSIVGAGVLSLPAGISAFGNAPSAMIPASFLIALIGIFSGYGFSLIGRVCALTGSTSYREAWEKSINKETSIIAAASCTFKTCLATTAYSMILADTFRAIFASVGLNLTRSTTLLSITSTVLLPLCLLKNLSSLAPFSLLGIVGMVYTAFAMGFRFFTKAYALPAGKFVADMPVSLQPSFGNVGASGVLNPSSFILICMLSTAYMAHFNAPKFYTELKDNTIKRYNTLVSTSFAISIAVFAIMAAFGFLTFGSASSGLILNNYSNKDVLMGLSRVAVAISLVFSYPLAFAGCRDGILDLANVPLSERTNGLLNKVTLAALSCITTSALVLNDVSFLFSIAGATLGNALIYVYPALMFRGAIKKMGDKATKAQKRETKIAMGNGILGTVMGVIGTRMALKSLGA